MSLHPGPKKVRISWRVSRSTQLRRIATVNTWEIRQVLFDTLMGYSTFAIGYCIIWGLLGVFLCFSLFFFEVRNLEQIKVSFQPVGGSLDTFCLHVGSLSQPCSTCFWSFNMLNETKIIGNHQKKATMSINQPFQLFNTSTRINIHLFFWGSYHCPAIEWPRLVWVDGLFSESDPWHVRGSMFWKPEVWKVVN